MAKKKSNLRDALIRMSSTLTVGTSEEGFIPDIITFVENEEYLGLASGPSPITLFPMQKIILKAFYRNSRGNEHLKLTEDERLFCEKHGLNSSDKGDILGKYDSSDIFRELILIWGRRSGKDFMASLIALYEAAKLLEIPGGDPYTYYGLAPGAPINILTIAASGPQSMTAFNEIREKVLRSKYFKDKFLNDGLESQKIWLLTPSDKELNRELSDKGMPLKKGSVCIEVGHSNPDTLVGKSVMCMIADEVASYRSGTGGPSTGERIYQLLTPMVNTYVKRTPVLDENGEQMYDDDGKPVVQRRYDGKIISISSPRGKEGKLYQLYETSHKSPGRLMCRVPTWEVNMFHTRESLRDSEPSMSEEEFEMEYGAKFSGTAGENMFIVDNIKNIFDNNLQLREMGQPGRIYFAHLDPATSSHNYALVVAHKESFVNKETNKADFVVVVDHIRFWHPMPDKPIDIAEVDEYLLSLKRRFYLGMVTYDLWNSMSSIQKLKKNGIPAKSTAYNRNYKMKIYTQLEELINSNKIIIPQVSDNPHMSKALGLLRQEMTELQRKYDRRGFKVYPKQEGDGAKSDDIVDALAGAVFSCVSRDLQKLPKGKLANVPLSPSSSSVAWRNMQGGLYGYGTGQQVSSSLERRSSWPNYKR